MNIQIRMGCQNEQLCSQIGWVLALLLLGGLAYFCFHLARQFLKMNKKK
jgi:hypothetical protein